MTGVQTCALPIYVLATQKYTLTYTVDGEVYHTESIALNTAIPTIEAPIKEGHTFNGWSELPAKMPAHNVTVENCDFTGIDGA